MREGRTQPPRGVTLLDVAKAAGVSRTTVSNAFNRPDQLSGELRDRVLGTARGLGYAGPNPIARMLRTGRAGVIAIMFPDTLPYTFSDPASVAFLQGAAQACQAERSGVLILPELDEGAAATAIGSSAVDGFVLYCWPEDSRILPSLAERRLPAVGVDIGAFPLGPLIGVDDRGGAAAAAAHLVGLGHRRLAVLTLELRPDGFTGRVDAARRGSASYHVTAERLGGYLEALARAGIDPASVPIEERPTGERAEAAAREAALALLACRPRPTAILAMSDRLAAGALQAAAQLGFQVPRDLSVIGFDDAPLAAQLVPPLTTVRQPLIEKGRLAAELLFRPTDQRRHVLPVSLVARRTTAPPP